MQKNPSLVIISGPSGCGKDTIIDIVRQRMSGIGLSVSCTTRAPRPKKPEGFEQHGVDYFFTTREAFEAGIRENGFLEYADNKGELYGTPRDYVEKLGQEGCDIVLLNIENLGAAQIKASEPNCVSIFILPPSGQEVRRRLIGRGTDPEATIEKRYQKGKEQVQMAYVYDYVVMNDDLETAVQDVIHILSAVRLRTMKNKDMIDRVNATYQEN